MTITDKSTSGWSAAISSTVLMSTVPAVASFAIRSGMNPTTLNAIRFALTAVLLAVTVWILPFGRVQINRRARLYCIAAGLVNSIGTLALFWSLTLINTSVSSMLVSIYPLFVLGILALLGEMFSLRQFVRLALGLVGVYFLLDPQGNVNGWGVVLALICAIAFSINIVIIQWYLKDYPSTQITYYTMTTMAVSVGGFWFIQGAEWHAPGWQGWMAILFLAVFGTYLARLLAYHSVQIIGSAELSLLSPLETFLTVSWSLIFLQERLTFFQWIGGALILASAILAFERKSRKVSYDSEGVSL